MQPPMSYTPTYKTPADKAAADKRLEQQNYIQALYQQKVAPRPGMYQAPQTEYKAPTLSAEQKLALLPGQESALVQKNLNSYMAGIPARTGRPLNAAQAQGVFQHNAPWIQGLVQTQLRTQFGDRGYYNPTKIRLTDPVKPYTVRKQFPF